MGAGGVAGWGWGGASVGVRAQFVFGGEGGYLNKHDCSLENIEPRGGGESR